MGSLISKLLIITVISLLFLGCNRTENHPEKTNTEIILNFWDISVPGDNIRDEIRESVLKQIEEENPNITINLKTMDGDRYKTTIQTAIEAGEAPDIFYTWLPAYSEDFVQSGKVLKLDNYLKEDTQNSLNMDAIKSGNALFDGIYALPIEVKMGVLYCNKTMFEQYNISLPNTIDELYITVDKFNDVGIRPLLAPGKRLWPIMWLYDILAIKQVGSSGVIESLSGRSNFTHSGYYRAAETFTELIDRKSFVENSLLMDNNEASDMFLNREVPMFFFGSWFAVGLTDPDNKLQDDIIAINFPGFDNGFEKHMLGGTGDGYMISNSSKHKEEATLVLERYTHLMGESEAVLFPVWKTQKDFSEKPPLYASLNTIYSNAEGFVIWWDTYMSSVDAQFHKNQTVVLFAGQLTPKEFYSTIQK